jgi:hypothetical protein
MKPTLRDYLTILCAILTVFLCGFGVGHLVAAKPAPAAADIPPAWEEKSLAILVTSLGLAGDDKRAAEAEIHTTAAAIRRERERTLLSYHEHLSSLYGRLIEQLGEPHATRLREEKRALDARIETLRPKT